MAGALKSPVRYGLFWAFKKLIFGSPLKNSAFRSERLGIFGALAILGSDALSSVAYATEEIFLALMILGNRGLVYATPVSILISIVLLIVIISYRQTVLAYPNGGGAYTVAKNEIGIPSALVAGASLLLDYVLTVAVSTAAGVRAVISLVPDWLPYSVEMAVVGVIFMTWINLRGVRESGRFLAVPLYGFLILILIVCGVGIWQIKSGAGPVFQAVEQSTSFNVLVLVVVLRAFAGGCTALTGIEAVANAVPIFKEPSARNAQKVYALLGVLLAGIFIAITILSYQWNLKPLETESLLSQLVRHVMGEGIFHILTQVMTAVVLFLAANTAFAGYPRLCALLAKDRWFPKQLAQVGDRLVYHKGILLLAALSIGILILFKANVHHLIPLYAVGVLTAFTFNQWGMMLYWRRHKKSNHKKSIYSHPVLFSCISGIGAITTFLVLLVTFEAKFMEGAYLWFILVPPICFGCLKIRNHYLSVEKQLIITPHQVETHRAFSTGVRRRVVVPISRMHLGSLEALAFAREMTKDVEALLVDINPAQTAVTRHQIEVLGWDIQVKVLPSPYRSILFPIVDYMTSLDNEAVIVFPEIVPRRWWQRYLHNETVLHLIKFLEEYAPHPGKTRIIITVPYHLSD